MSVSKTAASGPPPVLYRPVTQSDLGALTPFPKDLLFYLFEFLGIHDLMTVSLLNKYLNTLAEDSSTSLGKIKRAFRVFNGKIEFTRLPMPDQSYRFVLEGGGFRHYLSKKENEENIRVEITEPRAQQIGNQVCHYWVSSTLFVSKVGANWHSNQINYENMTIVSSDLPAFPALNEETPETVCLMQNQNFLEVVIKTAASAHLLKYVIDEKSGPAKFYLGELKHHIVCQLTMRNDANPAYEEVTSIAKIEKEQDQEVVKWSQPRNNDRFVQLRMDGKWLVLMSGSLYSQLHYHFLDVSSGREEYTYAARDISSLVTIGNLFVRLTKIFVEKNICIIFDGLTTLGENFNTIKVLKLDVKKSIPLSYRANQDLSWIVGTGIFKEMKFECDWTQENGFFKIESGSLDGQDYQAKFSGNPNVRPTSFSQSPPWYVRVFHSIVYFFRETHRLATFLTRAYIILIAPLICLLFLYALFRNQKK